MAVISTRSGRHRPNGHIMDSEWDKCPYCEQRKQESANIQKLSPKANKKKPRIFVGSSTESLDIAYTVQVNLEKDAEVTVWTQNIFTPSNYLLESLLHALKSAAFGIFILSPDDVIRMRDQYFGTVRDNVLFELGVFIGLLGKNRSFFIVPEDANDLHLPSDLLGLFPLTFNPNREDGNLNAALGPACNCIRCSILDTLKKDASAQRDKHIPEELQVSFAERRSFLTPFQQRLLAEIERMPAEFSNHTLRQMFFSDTPEREFYYRLEQLRLLDFIECCKPPNDYGQSDLKYRLTERFKHHLLSMDLPRQRYSSLKMLHQQEIDTSKVDESVHSISRIDYAGIQQSFHLLIK